MRAVTAEEHGGPEVLRLTEHDTPAPGPGQLLVDVAAAGVNFADIYARQGIPPYAARCLSCWAARAPGSSRPSARVPRDSARATGSPGPACPAATPSRSSFPPTARSRSPTGWTSRPRRRSCCRA